jgi:hypothetical protein
LRLFLFDVFHGQARSSSRRVSAPEFFGARLGMDRASAKDGHVKRETGSGKGSQGWCLPFGLPLSFARSTFKK